MYPLDDEDIDFEALVDQAYGRMPGVTGGGSSTAPAPTPLLQDHYAQPLPGIMPTTPQVPSDFTEGRPGMALGFPPAFPGMEQGTEDIDFEGLVDQEFPALAGQADPYQAIQQAQAMGAIPASQRAANEAAGSNFFEGLESGEAFLESPGLAVDPLQTAVASTGNLVMGAAAPIFQGAGVLGGNLASVGGRLFGNEQLEQGGAQLAQEQLEAMFRMGGGAAEATAETPALLLNQWIADMVPGGPEALRAMGISPDEFKARFDADPAGTLAMLAPAISHGPAGVRAVPRVVREIGTEGFGTIPDTLGLRRKKKPPPEPEKVPGLAEGPFEIDEPPGPPQTVQEAIDAHRNAMERAQTLPPEQRGAAQRAADRELQGHTRRLSGEEPGVREAGRRRAQIREEMDTIFADPDFQASTERGRELEDRYKALTKELEEAGEKVEPYEPEPGQAPPAVDEGFVRGRQALRDFKEALKKRKEAPPAVETAPARRPAPPDLVRIKGSDLYNTRTDLTDAGGTVKHSSRGGTEDITVGRRTLEELGYELPETVREVEQPRQDLKGAPQPVEPTTPEQKRRAEERARRAAAAAAEEEKPLPTFTEPEGPVSERVVKPKRAQPIPDLGDPSQGGELDPHKVAAYMARTDGLADTAEHQHAADNYVGPKGGRLPGLLRKKGLSRDEWAERLAQTGWFGSTDDYQAARNAAHDWLETEFASPKPRAHYEQGSLRAQEAAHEAAKTERATRTIARRIDSLGLKTTPEEVLGKPVETLRETELSPGDALYLPEKGDVYRVRTEDGQTVLQDGDKITLAFGEEVDAAKLESGRTPQPPSRGVAGERKRFPLKRRARLKLGGADKQGWQDVIGAAAADMNEAGRKLAQLSAEYPDRNFRIYNTPKGEQPYQIRSQKRPTMQQAREAIEAARAAREEREAVEAEIERKREEAAKTGQEALFDPDATQRARDEAARLAQEEDFGKAQETMFEEGAGKTQERRYAPLDKDTGAPLPERLTAEEAMEMVRTRGDEIRGFYDSKTRQELDKKLVGRKARKKQPAPTPTVPDDDIAFAPLPDETVSEAPLPAAAKTDQGVRTATVSRAERLRKLISSPQAVARRSEIVRSLESIGGAPIYGKRVNRAALGWFNHFRRVIRVRDKKSTTGPGGRPGSATVPHEVGHALQGILFPDLVEPRFDYRGPGAQQIRTELGKLGKDLYGSRKPTGGYKAEGFAEFVRMWVTDRDLAKQRAPRFALEFERRLNLDEWSVRTAEILDQAHADVQRYRQQPAVAKILSNISIGEKRRKQLRMRNLYEAWVDKDTWLGAAQQAMTGDKNRHGTGNAWTAVQLYRGTSGVADLVIRSGIPDIRRNRLLEILGQINKDLPAVRDGSIPIMDLPTATSDLTHKVRARALAELGNLIEVRNKEVYVSDAGRKYIEEHGNLKKLVDGLAEVIEPVSDLPLPFLAHAPASNAVSRFLDRVQGHKNANRGLDSFRVYGVAKRALSLLERETDRAQAAAAKGERYKPKGTEELVGIRWKDARDAIAEIEAANPKMAEVWEKYQAWNRTLIRLLEDEGFITGRERVAMTRYDYFPLRRVLDGLDEQTGIGGRKLVNVGKPVKHLRGSTLDIIDPLESSIHNAFQIVHAIMRNRVGRELLDTAELNPGSGWLIEPLAKDKIPVGLKLSEIKKEIERAFVKAQGSAFDPDLFDMVDFEVAARVWRPKMMAPAAENIVSIWRKGEQQWVQIDPELHRTLAGLDREQARLMIKTLGAPASWLRAGATLTPDFAAKNILRDAITAGLFGKADFLHSIPGVHQTSGLTTLAMEKAKVNGDDWYFRWKASGAASATMTSLDREYLQKGVREILTNTTYLRKAGAKVLNPLDTLQSISDVAENATRIGIFKEAAGRYGMDKTGLLRAAMDARDTTLDFSRRGRIIESYGRITAFLNANIQGVDKFGRVIFTEAMKDGKRARQFVTRTATFVVMPSLVAWALTRNDPNYDDLPDHIKDLFWVLPKGDGTFLKLPKPYDVGVIYGTGIERTMKWVDTQDPHALDGFAQVVIDNMIPTVIPTFLAAPWENASNTRLYGGRPVEPRREQDLDPAFRYGQFTSETSKAVAAGVRSLPESFSPDFLQSPRQVDNLIRGWTGGLGSNYVVPWVTDPLVKKIARETGRGELLGIGERTHLEKRLSERPLLRTFNTQPEDVGAGPVDKFYEKLDASEKAWRSWMGMPLEKGSTYLQDPEKRDLIVTYHAVQETGRKLAALQNSRRDALSRGNRDEALDWWKRIVAETKEGERKIDLARKDPTALEAAYFDHKVREQRTEADGRRVAYSNAMTNMIDAMPSMQDGPGWRGVDTWVRTNVPKEEWAWAKDFAREYALSKMRNAKEEAVHRAPKKYRLKAAEGATP